MSAPRPVDLTFLRRLRHLSLIEGVSTLLLFGVAMPLKYFAGMPLAVSIVGGLHGILFIALVAMFAIAIRRVPLPWMLAAIGCLAAIVPGGPFLMDPRLKTLEEDAP